MPLPQTALAAAKSKFYTEIAPLIRDYAISHGLNCTLSHITLPCLRIPQHNGGIRLYYYHIEIDGRLSGQNVKLFNGSNQRYDEETFAVFLEAMQRGKLEFVDKGAKMRLPLREEEWRERAVINEERRNESVELFPEAPPTRQEELWEGGVGRKFADTLKNFAAREGVVIPEGRLYPNNARWRYLHQHRHTGVLGRLAQGKGINLEQVTGQQLTFLRHAIEDGNFVIEVDRACQVDSSLIEMSFSQWGSEEGEIKSRLNSSDLQSRHANLSATPSRFQLSCKTSRSTSPIPALPENFSFSEVVTAVDDVLHQAALQQGIPIPRDDIGKYQSSDTYVWNLKYGPNFPEDIRLDALLRRQWDQYQPGDVYALRRAFEDGRIHLVVIPQIEDHLNVIKPDLITPLSVLWPSPAPDRPPKPELPINKPTPSIKSEMTKLLQHLADIYGFEIPPEDLISGRPSPNAPKTWQYQLDYENEEQNSVVIQLARGFEPRDECGPEDLKALQNAIEEGRFSILSGRRAYEDDEPPTAREIKPNPEPHPPKQLSPPQSQPPLTQDKDFQALHSLLSTERSLTSTLRQNLASTTSFLTSLQSQLASLQTDKSFADQANTLTKNTIDMLLSSLQVKDAELTALVSQSATSSTFTPSTSTSASTPGMAARVEAFSEMGQREPEMARLKQELDSAEVAAMRRERDAAIEAKRVATKALEKKHSIEIDREHALLDAQKQIHIREKTIKDLESRYVSSQTETGKKLLSARQELEDINRLYETSKWQLSQEKEKTERLVRKLSEERKRCEGLERDEEERRRGGDKRKREEEGGREGERRWKRGKEAVDDLGRFHY